MPDPHRLDWAVAGVLTVSGQLEVWLGAGAAHERAVAAALGPVVTGSVAVRRRYPALAGAAAGAVMAAFAAFWGEPQVVSFAIAWVCALYGLAVWAEPRPFALGAA